MRTPEYIILADTVTGAKAAFHVDDQPGLVRWTAGQMPGADDATLEVAGEMIDLITSGRALSPQVRAKAHYLAFTIDVSYREGITP